MSWQIPQGGCNFTPALFGDNPGASWFVRDSGGTVIGSSFGPANGWAAGVASYPGGASVTCCSPVSATIAPNYTLQLLPSGNYYAFDVVMGATPPGGSRRRTGGGWW